MHQVKSNKKKAVQWVSVKVLIKQSYDFHCYFISIFETKFIYLFLVSETSWNL